MKGWLMFILVPLTLIFIVLFLVIVQIWQTRSAMAEFALQHGMTYEKARVPFFGRGEIRGAVNGAPFFMGMMSMYHSPEKDERDMTYVKNLSMHILINGMPSTQIIHIRSSSSYVTDARLSQTVTPPIKTGDADFDSRFCVYGKEKEVLPWLTAERRTAIATILLEGNCTVAKGGFIIPRSETRLRLKDLEEMFAHLTAAQKGF